MQNILFSRSRSYFYPRSPCGERQAMDNLSSKKAVFLSTLSLRRATTVIQALTNHIFHFYPRSPCGERPQQGLTPALTASFLSTLSLRRATWTRLSSPAGCGYFYPRSPCGERLYCVPHYKAAPAISIHALLAESDQNVPFGVGMVSSISIHALLAESDYLQLEH